MSEAIHGGKNLIARLHKTIHSGVNWVARLHLFGRLKEWQSITGSFLAILVAIYITGALTTSMKRTDSFLNFTTRYHQIRVDAHALDKKMRHPPAMPNPETADESDAHEIYFRLFGLIYDEIHSYRDGFLAEDALVDWMTWQMYDHRDGQFKIGGLSYDEGWRWWLTTPGKHSRYTPMLREIFACCKGGQCVKDAIEYHMRSSLLNLIFRQPLARSCDAAPQAFRPS